MFPDGYNRLQGGNVYGIDVRSEDSGELQRLVNAVFAPGISSRATCSKLDVVARAEIFDLGEELREVVEALPSRTYTRQHLCDQLNSILVAHGWTSRYDTVE